ncbi:MAG: UPF0182 family protein [Caldilineaceae bacterium]
MRNDDPFADLIRSLEENLQRSGPSRPGGGDDGDDLIPPRRPENVEFPQFNPRRFLWILIPLLLLIFFNRILSFYADWFWYDSLGFSSVFFTRIWATFGLFITAALAFWIFLAANILIARRIEPRGFAGTPFELIASAMRIRITPILLFGGLIVALLVGATVSGDWEEVLVYLNHGNFNLTDPIFHRDVSFFLFTLPIWQGLRSWLMTTTILTLIATAVIYGIGWRGWNSRTPVLTHLSVLGAIILLLIAWQYRLNALQLVYSQRGVVLGAGYTDVHAQLPAYNLLSLVTVATAILLVVTVFLRQAWRAIVVVLVVWVAVAVLAGNIYPGLVQRFQVSPNELSLEREYIANNIEYTRIAFDLDQIETRNYDASAPLTADALRAEPQTVSNIRLWDYRPLLQTYNQLQALSQYHEFNDVDVDRYKIDGEVRQVMLAARELVPERLNATAQTWVNLKLIYTHGYGVAASPVAQVTSDGLPEFVLQNLPPTGAITLTQPQIYFGEKTNDYVIGNTTTEEFDYSKPDQNVMTSFAAQSGIAMTWSARLLFALYFADPNLLLNSDIHADSQLLWRRNISERPRLIAPFLRYDNDPYIVISDDGRLFWFQDAYTVSDRFPYSEQFGPINYIRNSVKVVTNAYDGTMVFYVMDESEPIIAAYERIFPDLFKPFSAMPDDLKAHIRYPNDLFTAQAAVYRTYHMTNVNEFYNKEDVWAWPQEIFESKPQDMEPYYVLMQLPGSNELNFIQILPFTPANRENMIAWLAAKNDPQNYGEKVVYEFGKDTLFYGPKQVEARIDQDPEISAQLSLWNQQGSNVIRGNLLVIPLAESLLYVEPLYLQAANGQIPELKRVILATANRVIMANNLGLALADLFGSDILAETGLDMLAAGGEPSSTGSTPPSTAGGIGVGNATLEELIIQANSAYEQAQSNLRDGDWTGYGQQMEILRSTLQQLVTLNGGVAPSNTITDTIPADSTGQ